MDDFDTDYLGKDCEWWDDRKPEIFYYNLTEEIIENWWNERRTQRNQAGPPIEYPGYIKIVPHCTPTKKKRKITTPNGLVDTKFLAHSICKVCREKTPYVCSSCVDYLCREKSGHFCLDTHREENH